MGIAGVLSGARASLPLLLALILSSKDDGGLASLITPSELASALLSSPSSPSFGSEHIVVIDVVSPPDAARDPRRIPTSRRAWRPDYELPATTESAEHGLVGLVPTADQFSAFARRMGVRRDSAVVLVDRKYDAARLWWLFQYFGPAPAGGVHLLDGGYQGWVEGGFPTTTTTTTKNAEDGSCDEAEHGSGASNSSGSINDCADYERVEYSHRPSDEGDGEFWTASDPPNRRLLATMNDVRTMKGETSSIGRDFSLPSGSRPTQRLWDVRTIEEHNGEILLEGASRPGRIPWTDRRVDWDMFRQISPIGDDDSGSSFNFSADSPVIAESEGGGGGDGGGEGNWWHSPSAIRSIATSCLEGTEPGDGVQHTFYCQSAVRTTQLIFGMCRAGWKLEDLRNYDGSWVEWSHCAREDEISVEG